MARINVDNEFLSDPRLYLLSSKMPRYQAMGVVVALWEVGQAYWKKNKGLIPGSVFNSLPKKKYLLEAGFVEERDQGFYCKGAEERWGFLLKKSEAGRVGGKRSAEKRREKYGTAVPMNATNSDLNGSGRSKTERKSSKPNPSSSASSSFSSSASDSSSFSDSEKIKNNYVSSEAEKASASRADVGAILIFRGQGDILNQRLANVSHKIQNAWVETFPSADWIVDEIRRAHSWLLSNPHKNPKKFDRFMTNWLNRSFESYRKGLPSRPMTMSEKNEVSLKDLYSRVERGEL